MEDYRVANEDTSNEVMEKNERENAEVQSKKETNEKVVQQSSNEKSAEKPKKKVKKVNVKVTDHDETDKVQDQEKSEMSGMGDTLFILDLMRQRKEKLMRKKKDEMINDMAMKKKQQMMEARMGKRVLTRPATGGFMGK